MEKKASIETKLKMCKNHADFSGKNHPQYGKTLSNETIEKIRSAQLGKNSAWFGRHHSEKSKEQNG